MNFKVILFQDDIYQVFEVDEDGMVYWSTVLFQGTLPECAAWIALKEKNYM